MRQNGALNDNNLHLQSKTHEPIRLWRFGNQHSLILDFPLCLLLRDLHVCGLNRLSSRFQGQFVKRLCEQPRVPADEQRCFRTLVVPFKPLAVSSEEVIGPVRRC